MSAKAKAMMERLNNKSNTMLDNGKADLDVNNTIVSRLILFRFVT